MKRQLLICAVAAAVVGCVPPPIPPATPHEATDVSASFGKTWDALIDDFARNNIPIKTIERASGLIATDRLGVGASLWDAAYCGKNWTGDYMRPTGVEYNALVRGDSTRSTIRVTARWTRAGKGRSLANQDADVVEECSSRGTWEVSLQDQVKKAAESLVSSSRGP